MNTKLIGGIVALVLVAGGAFFVLSGDDDAGSDGANNQSSQLDENADGVESTASNQLGINTAALEGAYRLDIDSVDNGEKLTGTFLLDGNGNFSAEFTQDGQNVGYIFLDDVTYIQDPSSQSWLSYPAGSPSAPSFDLEELSISDEDIEEINNDDNVTLVGEEACSLGTCRVYEDTDELQNETARIKVDTATGRIAEVALTNNETNEVSTIMYSYPGEVTITAPEGATELDINSLTQ